MIDQLLHQFLEHLRYERNVSEHTLRNYASDLEQFHDFLAAADPQTGKRNEPPIQQIDHLTIREWLATLHSAQKKKTSVARKLAVLRTFFQFLVREGVVELNPAKLVSTPRLEKKLPKHLSVEDAIRFIETPDVETDLGKRDRAMLELLYATGVRVAELTKLNLQDIDFKNKLIRVSGKRRKERIAPSATRPRTRCKIIWSPAKGSSWPPRSRCESRKHCFSTIRAPGSRHGRSVEWSRSTSKSAPVCTRSARTLCATHLPRTCWTAALTCATSRSCSATRVCPPRRSTPTSPWRN
jgi:integrase